MLILQQENWIISPKKPLLLKGPLLQLSVEFCSRQRMQDHRADSVFVLAVCFLIKGMNGSLYPHLMEVEQTAESRMQQTMEQLLKQDPAPDKAQNQLMWVQHMNSLKAQAEELVLTELIYS